MSEQLQLPYQEIKPTDIVNRSFLRENFKRSDLSFFHIEFEKLQIRDGFNQRIKYEGIEELAESIKEHGLIEPITVDFLKSGIAYIEKGHRRYKAVCLLRERGEAFDTLPCLINNSTTSEEERFTRIYTSNMFSSQLHVVEQANIAVKLKTVFGIKSNDEIGKKLGVSRQKVDNLISIGTASDEVKNQMLSGSLTMNDALAQMRANKKAEKQGEKSELESRITLPHLPEPKDNLAKDIKELNDLENDNDQEEVIKQAQEEKERFDSSREEVSLCLNVIKNLDKLENQVSKFDIPEQSKDDLSRLVSFIQKDMEQVTEWVNKNKNQNKIR